MATPTQFDDLLIGTAGADLIDGLGGDDTILGEEGDDVLIGGVETIQFLAVLAMTRLREVTATTYSLVVLEMTSSMAEAGMTLSE